MRKTLSIIVLALGLAFAGAPAASAAYPPEAAPDACTPYTDALYEQTVAEGDEIYARDQTIAELREHVEDLHWRLQTRRAILRHEVRRQRSEIRHLRAQVRALRSQGVR